MMKTLSIAPCLCSRWSCLCLALALVGCGSKDGGFNGETAPYGAMTATTQVHATARFSASSLFAGPPLSLVTGIVGQKAMGQDSYARLATSLVDDPSKNIEYWVKENSDKTTLTFAGLSGTGLASGITVPDSSITFPAPINLNLNPTVGQVQAVTTGGMVSPIDAGVDAGHLLSAHGPQTISSDDVTGEYTLVEANATVVTGMGPVSGCSHFTGWFMSTSASLPEALRGQKVSGELWYHPSFGVVAFNTTNLGTVDLGIGTTMTDSDDCGSVDSSGYKTIRKVGMVDASSSFELDTYDCDGKQYLADKNVEASMLLELRWADGTQAKTEAQPLPKVEFGTPMGWFPNSMTEQSTSTFYPEENSNGFKYWSSYVKQANKNDPGDDSTAYHIKVGAVAGLLPVRVTARIHYKVLQTTVSGLDGGATSVKSDASTESEAGATSVQEEVLFSNWNLGGVNGGGSSPSFTIAVPYAITFIDTYHWTGTAVPTGTIALSPGFGPWQAISPNQTYWVVNFKDPGQAVDFRTPPARVTPGAQYPVLPAGTYTVIDSDPATWSQDQGSGGQGFALVKGYPAKLDGKRDGGTDQSRDVTGAMGDVKDSGLADAPSDAGGGRTEGGTNPGITTCNLIVNGNAEGAVGSTDGTPVSTPGWTATGEATAGQYGAPFGYAGLTDPGPDDRGNNLFAGGIADPTSTLTQTVNVSQYASAIDTGGVSYLLSAYLGGWNGQDDNAVLTVTFQNVSGSALGTGSIGPVLSSERAGVSGLLFRSTSGAVPAGTRTALVVLTITRTEGSANDGYADNLLLAFGGAGIPSSTCSPGSGVDGGAGADGGKDTTVATGGDDSGVPCGAGTPCPTAIHSTTSGGTWSDTSTWVEKVVPTAASDVEISGPVVIAAEAPCNNLTIKSGGSLQNVGRGDPYGPTPTTINGNLTIEAGGTLTNEPGYRSRIVVVGNCANGGTIKNSSAGVLLEVKKSFAQNGTYEGPSITFNGGTDQTISCGAGKKIMGSITVSNPAKSIKATSDMYLENVTVALSDTTSQGTFDMNGFKLFVSGGAAALITDDTSNHVPRVKYTNVAGITCVDGAMIYESSFANSSAPITIDGVLTTVGHGAGGTQVTFDGDLTINAGATMQNELGYHSGVVVTGSLVNNGTVNGRAGGYGFEIKKNFTQNNVYTTTETTFSGAGVQTISMGATKKIAGTIVLANAKSGGTLKVLSDLTVENVTFTVGDTTTTTAIDMSQNKLVLVGGANALICDDTSNHVPRVTFTNIGGITGASPDTATDAMIWESSFENISGTITLAGQFRTVGRAGEGTQIRFTGNVVLATDALWRNEPGYRSGITISGSFTKNGTVVSESGTNLLINDTAY
jgi:hypothetical protein